MKIKASEGEENETTAEGAEDSRFLTRRCCLGNKRSNMFGRRSAFVLQALLLWAA